MVARRRADVGPGATPARGDPGGACGRPPMPPDEPGPSCRRDPSGRLHLTSRCFAVLVVAGLAAGVLSGLFGVGGGFVIVPALVLVTGMGIHRAVATSLLVIALVSASGVASYLVAGRPLPLALTGLFVAGGVAGMELGHAGWPSPGRPRTAEALRLGDGRRGRLHRGQEPHLRQEHPVFFHQRFVPGLAIYSYMVGDEKSKQVCRHRPDQGRGRVPRDRQAGGAADHARPGDARPRRLRERIGRVEGPAGRRGAGRRLRAWAATEWTPPYADRVVGDGDEIALGTVRLKAIHTPGHTPRARLLGAVRRHPQQGHPLADLHRRLPVRRRRGPARPAGRGGPQEAGPPALRERLRRAAGPARLHRGLPRPRGRVALRQGDRLPQHLQPRLRASVQRGAPAAGRSPSGSPPC